jgi:pimeloyl-ACP methyl ester carboxylesterase
MDGVDIAEFRVRQSSGSRATYNGPMRLSARIGRDDLTLTLLVLAAVVIGIPAAAWWMQERLIFFPQPLVSTSHLPASTSALELTAADGTRLRGWVVGASAVPAPTLIVFGGNAEEISWALADARWPRGWTRAGFNYRGYGESEGVPSEAALIADAKAIFDAIAGRPDVDPRRIVVFGRSLGTGVAVSLASARPVAGVVLVSPYDSLAAVGRAHYPFLPVSLLLRHRFESLALAQSVHTPLLAIVAADDAIIPLERSRALYDAWGGPKRWHAIERADHNDVSMHEPFWRSIAAFLSDMRASP